jgi:hypothetical protein
MRGIYFRSQGDSFSLMGAPHPPLRPGARVAWARGEFSRNHNGLTATATRENSTSNMGTSMGRRDRNGKSQVISILRSGWGIRNRGLDDLGVGARTGGALGEQQLQRLDATL